MFGPLGERLYHYTSGTKAIDLILPSMRLMLNPFAAMRDPRESSLWLLTAFWDGALRGSASHDPDPTAVMREVIEAGSAAKLKFKIASLTHDDVTHVLEDELTDSLAYGYGHPRLWEPYADNYAGACLCFNRFRLLEAFKDQFAVRGFYSLGPIIYRQDRGVDRELLFVRMTRVREFGVVGAVDRHLQKHCEEFFFHKLRDWETEAEFRLLYFADHDQPEFMDISGCIETVLCGYLMPEDEIDRVIAICEPHGIAVHRLRWLNALPMWMPAKPTGGGAFIDAIVPNDLPDYV